MRIRSAIRRKRQGIVLVTMAVWAVILFGAAGLAIDAGRLFINKNEAQAFVDSAALAAAQKLDGTANGLTAARSAVASSQNKWDFDSKAYPPARIEFSRPDAPNSWESNPASPLNYTRIRVTVSLQQQLFFAPMVRERYQQSIGAGGTAVAEQLPQTFFNQGLWPFAPFAFNGESGPHFGLVPGEKYTIRYPSSNHTQPCEGDRRDNTHKRYGDDRGWWGDNSTAILTDRIVNDRQMPGEPAILNEPLPSVGGARTTASDEINERRLQDTDPNAANFAEYLANGAGNGRRIVVMPVQDVSTAVVRTFGQFFVLMPNEYIHSGNKAWCAEYIGKAYIPNSPTHGAGTPGAYSIRLVNQ